MRPLTKIAFAAAVAGIVVYAAAFLICYIQLRAHQPSHELGAPMATDVTSFPPSTAWLVALPCGLFAFVCVLGIGLIAPKFRGRTHLNAEG